MASPTIACLPEGIVLACLSVAVATDVARRIIPNRLVLLVLACGIALRSLSAPSPLWLGILSPVAVLTALGLLASHDFIGWGDTKLITAVSVSVPPDRLFTLLIAIALAGGVLSGLYLACRFVLWQPTPRAVEAHSLAACATGSEPAPVPCVEPVKTWMAGPSPAMTYTAGGACPTWLASLLDVLRRERARIIAGEPLPYAVAIAGGALYTFFTG